MESSKQQEICRLIDVSKKRIEQMITGEQDFAKLELLAFNGKWNKNLAKKVWEHHNMNHVLASDFNHRR